MTLCTLGFLASGACWPSLVYSYDVLTTSSFYIAGNFEKITCIILSLKGEMLDLQISQNIVIWIQQCLRTNFKHLAFLMKYWMEYIPRLQWLLSRSGRIQGKIISMEYQQIYLMEYTPEFKLIRKYPWKTSLRKLSFNSFNGFGCD